MSTTSNSRGDRPALALALLLLLAGCASTSSNAVAPEGPRQGPRVQPDRRVDGAVTRDQRVEIESASLRRAGDDPAMMERMNLRDSGMMLIDVRTEKPLGNLGRSASPVIVLDGEPLLDTFPIDQRRLVAPVGGRSLRSGEHTVAVTWLGAESTTTSRKRYVLRVP